MNSSSKEVLKTLHPPKQAKNLFGRDLNEWIMLQDHLETIIFVGLKH